MTSATTTTTTTTKILRCVLNLQLMNRFSFLIPIHVFYEHIFRLRDYECDGQSIKYVDFEGILGTTCAHRTTLVKFLQRRSFGRILATLQQLHRFRTFTMGDNLGTKCKQWGTNENETRNLAGVVLLKVLRQVQVQ